MSATQITNPQEHPEELRSEHDEGLAKPYHQRPDEPDRWYDRFHHFCLLGPNRTLIQCCRQVLAESLEDTVSNAEKQFELRDRRVPGAWVAKAREYNWRSRAAAWDADRRQMAFKNLEGTLNLVSEAAREALQFQIDLMRGWIKDHDGKRIPVVDIYQRRMASKTLLKWAVELQALLQQDQAEERGEIKITEIRVQEPGIRPG